VILFALQTTLLVGLWFVGDDFSLQQHQSLVDLVQTGSPAMKILLVVSAVLIAPIFEELMFRGLVQSTLTAYLQKPLLSIVITSLIFSTLHPSTHFAGIFVLSCGMGLAYEKSGSLIRSIWIHILFNSISIIGTLAEI
jgi:membrane protease YdiL (CAAX protease family)